MKDKKVFFVPKDEEIYNCTDGLAPAKKYIPDWFKQMPASLLKIDNTTEDFTAKRCIPFTDSFMLGYIQELPCDVIVMYDGYNKENNTDIIKYSWSGPIRPMSTREEDFKSRRVLPDFDGYYKAEFHWNTFWEPETPEGYSTLYLHPLNRYDLPFITLNGVIDTDKWSISGPIPFMIKKGFEGIIPAGTPIYQTVFIKREVWNSEIKEYDKQKQLRTNYSVRRFFNSGYKKLYWSKKEYN
jgi:hypothetical protein